MRFPKKREHAFIFVVRISYHSKLRNFAISCPLGILEVDDSYMPAIVNENIPGAQISVNPAVLMHRLDDCV